MKFLLLFSLITFSNIANACFSGYYAPEFMEVTNPIIGVSIIFVIISTSVAIKQKAFIRATSATLIYLLFSYYGHYMYSGDCGAQIVFFNKVALAFVVLWLSIEISLAYKNVKNKKA